MFKKTAFLLFALNTFPLFASKYSRPTFKHFSMKCKFADPINEIVFKKLFVDSAILVDFVNKALPTKNIKTVEYIPTNMDPEVRFRRQSIIDVLCTDENGSKYIVEMQSAIEKGFEERAQYYASKTYGGSQLDKGAQYSDLLEVIYIAITDFVKFPENTDYLSFHKIIDSKTNQQNSKDFTFVYIEVPKYKSHENAQGIDEWIDLFKTASDRKTFETSNPNIKKAYEMLEFTNWTDQELLDFEAYQKILLDYQVRNERIYDEGLAAGKAEAKAKLEVIKKMLKENFDVENISKCTGFSQDEIRIICNELQLNKGV